MAPEIGRERHTLFTYSSEESRVLPLQRGGTDPDSGSNFVMRWRQFNLGEGSDSVEDSEDQTDPRTHSELSPTTCMTQ